MSDENILNDPELTRLERQLAAVTLSPTPAQRERLLYACGQAAGRAHMRRRVQALTAIAGVLACVSVGLGISLLAHHGPEMTVVGTAITPRVDEQPPDRAIDSSAGEKPQEKADRDDELTAAWSWERLANSDRLRTTGTLQANAGPQFSKSILKAAGPLPTEEL
jgi:hypothetical protein